MTSDFSTLTDDELLATSSTPTTSEAWAFEWLRREEIRKAKCDASWVAVKSQEVSKSINREAFNVAIGAAIFLFTPWWPVRTFGAFCVAASLIRLVRILWSRQLS